MSKLDDMLGAEKFAEVIRNAPKEEEDNNVSEVATFEVANFTRSEYNAMIDRIYEEYAYLQSDDGSQMIEDDEVRKSYSESLQQMLSGIVAGSMNAHAPDGTPIVRVGISIEDYIGILFLFISDWENRENADIPDYAADLGKTF